MIWNEYSDMKEWKIMNWHESIEMKGISKFKLQWRNWKEWIAKSAPTEIELSLQSRAHFVDLIFQKVVWCPQIFTSEIELSLQSRARFVDPIFQKVVWCPQILTSEIELSPQYRAHFVDLIFQKWSDVPNF